MFILTSSTHTGGFGYPSMNPLVQKYIEYVGNDAPSGNIVRSISNSAPFNACSGWYYRKATPSHSCSNLARTGTMVPECMLYLSPSSFSVSITIPLSKRLGRQSCTKDHPIEATYCNTDTVWQIERLNNCSEFFEENIFKPLGMTDTTFHPENRPDIESRLAEMTVRTPEGILVPGTQVYNRPAQHDLGGVGGYSVRPKPI